MVDPRDVARLISENPDEIAQGMNPPNTEDPNIPAELVCNERANRRFNNYGFRQTKLNQRNTTRPNEVTKEQIIDAVTQKGLYYIEIEGDGVSYDDQEMTIELLPTHIAVKGETEDDMSWEILRNPTMDDILNTIDNPSWFM